MECLVALTVFTVGALGAAGTMALGIRTAASGTHAAAAARLAAEALEALRHRLRLGHQACAVLAPGSLTGPSGEALSWALTPAAGGVGVRLVITYATPAGQHIDSIRGFLRCQ